MMHKLIPGIAVCCLALAWPAAAVPIWDIVGQVSQSSYTSYLRDSLYTHNGDNRGAAGAGHAEGADHDPAAAVIYDLFASFGLTTSYNVGDWQGVGYTNVVGVLPGLIRPNEIYVLGAHYDSVWNPGADDDASGVAGLLEAARVLSQYDFATTLIFIAFDAEELGLRGSTGYAYAHRNDDIRGMVELDMIAYNNPSYLNQVAVMRPRRDRWHELQAEMIGMINTYSDGLTGYDRGTSGASDHQAFDDYYKPDCLLIEDGFNESGWPLNPYYHTQQDSVDTANYIDYLYATRITRAAVAYLATHGDDIPEPGAGILFALGTLVLLAVRRTQRQSAKECVEENGDHAGPDSLRIRRFP